MADDSQNALARLDQTLEAVQHLEKKLLAPKDVLSTVMDNPVVRVVVLPLLIATATLWVQQQFTPLLLQAASIAQSVTGIEKRMEEFNKSLERAAQERRNLEDRIRDLEVTAGVHPRRIR